VLDGPQSSLAINDWYHVAIEIAASKRGQNLMNEGEDAHLKRYSHRRESWLSLDLKYGWDALARRCFYLTRPH
jgi:hypothetical protein